MSELLLPVTKVQKFCTQDGPGVRTTVFLKGCPLHCAWCHNPETQSPFPQLLYTQTLCVGCGGCAAVCPTHAHSFGPDGTHHYDPHICTGCGRCADVCCTGACENASRPMRVSDILQLVAQDTAFYGETGGLTLSGGEPFFHAEGALTLLREAKAMGLHTAVETCGFFSQTLTEALPELVDLFLWDIKDSDDARHKAYTGVSALPIRENLARIDALGGRTRLRCILVSGVNLTGLPAQDEPHLQALAALFCTLRHCEGIDLLPYHAYGSSKAVQLGRQDPAHPEWIPSAETVTAAAEFFRQQNIPVRCM